MSYPHGAPRAATYSAVPVHGRPAQSEDTPRKTSVMRRFEVQSLREDGEVRLSHHIAPASALFEATASAFARGTLLQSTEGPVAIEDLLPGDKLITREYGALPVLWINSTTLVPGAGDGTSDMTRLSRVTAEAFGLGKPLADLMMGPGARIVNARPGLADLTGSPEVLTELRDFIDGMSVIEVTPPTPVRLYHLRLEHHATISAGGLWVETYHPGLNMRTGLGQNMRSLFLSLFSDISEMSEFGALTYPRVSREKLDSLSAA